MDLLTFVFWLEDIIPIYQRIALERLCEIEAIGLETAAEREYFERELDKACAIERVFVCHDFVLREIVIDEWSTTYILATSDESIEIGEVDHGMHFGDCVAAYHEFTKDNHYA